MKITATALSLCILLVISSCDDVMPVGFNIKKVLPIEFPVELEGTDDPLLNNTVLNSNPPAYTLTETFDLKDLTAGFDNSVIDSLSIQGIYYKIEGVDIGSEDFQMDEFSIEVIKDNGDNIIQFTLYENEKVRDITKTKVEDFDAIALVAALQNGETITVIAILDFAEIPHPVDFDFTFFFDTYARVRP